ncbi:PEP-CTERM sorting domain-containing protein, partial [Haloferula sp. A504]|uniref:PEP-CTERM sorting domain-containing protein n=1 Tax=Haloferula sp. A504 TaxID=3373601 RepID=UPI0031BBCFE6|nr:PEP-CTERM sorting domain-containing protein [Verrucomicrobiaceae bacterium E54]
VVGEMIFGATDTINIYLPDAALNQGSVVASNTATLDQTAFDTVTFASKGDGAYAVDEIRFGTSYDDVVIAVPEPSVFASLGSVLGFLLLRRRRAV